MCNQPDAHGWSRHPAVPLRPVPARQKAANIVQCTVATDSVVATVTVKTGGTMRRIVVQWGDGAVNTLRNRPGVEFAIGQQHLLPQGTYKLSHAYEAPQDRKPFQQITLVRVEDVSGGVDFCINPITLTPRYSVVHYRTRLNLESQCDSAFESRSEFDIRLFVDQELVNTWRWEPGQSIVPEIPFVLEGSIFRRELTVADGVLSAHLELTETDPLFDDHLSAWMILSAMDVSGSISQVIEGDGCKVRYSYDKEVTLIRPLPSYGQTVVAAVDP